MFNRFLTLLFFCLGICGFASFGFGQDNSSSFRIHAADRIHQLGFTGEGVIIGVLDSNGTTEPNPTEEARTLLESGRLTRDSWIPISIVGHQESHDLSVINLINSRLPGISLAPKALVQFAFSGENHEKPDTDPSGKITTWNWSQVKDTPSTVEALKRLTEKSQSILIPKGVPLSNPDELRLILLRFVRRGGLLIIPLGNQKLMWSQKAFSSLESQVSTQTCWNEQDCSYITDVLFFRWMSDENQKEIFDATLFVGALEQNGKSFQSFSNGPGDFAPHRTLFAVGENLFTNPEHRVTGTSFSAAWVAGAIALLSQAYPECSHQKIAQALLDTANISDLQLKSKGQLVRANLVRPEIVSKFFGRGSLQIQSAFEILKKD